MGTAFTSDLQSEAFVPDTAIMKEGEPASVSGGIYFIRSGVADIMAQRGADSVKPSSVVIGVIGDGCYFGDVAVIFGKKRTATVRASTMLICYSLSGDAWDRLFTTFDYLKDYVTLIAKRRDERTKILSKIAVAAHKSGDSTALKKAQRQYRDEEDGLTEYVGALRRKDEMQASGARNWKNIQRRTIAINAIALESPDKSDKGETKESVVEMYTAA